MSGTLTALAVIDALADAGIRASWEDTGGGVMNVSVFVTDDAGEIAWEVGVSASGEWGPVPIDAPVPSVSVTLYDALGEFDSVAWAGDAGDLSSSAVWADSVPRVVELVARAVAYVRDGAA